MTVRLKDVAEWVGGELLGDPEWPVSAARPLADAAPGDLTFVEDDRHLPRWQSSPVAAALVGSRVPAVPGRSIIRVADPLMAFAEVFRRLHGLPELTPPTVHPSAVVHPAAQLGEGVDIGPLAVIGEGAEVGAGCRIHAGAVVGRYCRLGEGCTLFPNAVLYDGSVLGKRVIVHANAVVGADGFGYRFQAGRHAKVPQLGHAELGDDVEIGACTTIDRGTFGPTKVGTGTKIDNLVMVAHNCRLGRHNLIVSQVGLAGSTTTGDYVVLAGQVGVTGHLHIGDGTQVGGQSAVIRDLPPGQRVLGSPARPEREEKRILMTLEKLPEMRRQIMRIMAHLGLTESEAA